MVEVFATLDATARYGALRDAAPAWAVVEDRALASLSDSVTPAGLVAVCRFLDVPFLSLVQGARASVVEGPQASVVEGPQASVVEGPQVSVVEVRAQRASKPLNLVAICADVRDPGNAGTVIRTADAAGADAVVLAGSSVDAYNPKTVRASAGSLFHLPIAIEPDVEAAVTAARTAGLVVLAADGAGEVSLDEAADLLAVPTAWLFGNEAWGLPPATAALADHRVRIPIHGRAESLNLSTAAALCLYGSASAHRHTP